MRILKRIFGKSESQTKGNILEKISIGSYFYLMNYKEHYSEFLEEIKNEDKVIAELFVFRAWTTQFGFRMFSTQPDISEEIIGQVWNQGKLGIGMLNQLENVDIEKEFQLDYFELMENRWQELDRVFIANNSNEIPIPTRQICSQVMNFCGIKNPFKYMWLCTDFVNQLDKIKHEAINTGLLR